MDSSLDSFFNRAAETLINDRMMFKNYVFPVREVEKYIDEIVARPIDEYIEFICAASPVCMTPKDIPQFSDFEDGRLTIAMAMRRTGNPGLTFFQLGKLLQDDGKVRKVGADRKYGENHAKLAESLGIVRSMDGYYFLSCIGEMLDRLSQPVMKQLTVRLILRIKMFQYFVQQTQVSQIDVYELCKQLDFHDSTYARRRSNIRALLQIMACDNNPRLLNICNNVVLPKSRTENSRQIMGIMKKFNRSLSDSPDYYEPHLGASGKVADIDCGNP